jgi:hypothetical protein
MPDIVKIGITSREDLNKRLKELFTTSVPFSFDCEYACKVDDCVAVEKALQIAFNPNRINPQREFFKIEPEQVIAILKLLQREDVTPEVTKEIDESISLTDKKSGEIYKRQRRPPLNFLEMGIPIDSMLTFDNNDIEINAKVISDKKVSYNETEYSLTKLTRELLEIDHDVQPTRYWYFNGKCLKEYYDETYTEEE